MKSPYERVIVRGIPQLQVFDTVGDGSGTFDMRVNGSVTPVDFKLSVPDGYTYFLTSITVSMYSTVQQAVSGFGSIDALTNGLLVGIYRRDGSFSNLVPCPIKTTACYVHYGASLTDISGTAKTHFTINLKFPEVYGGPVRLISGTSYAFIVRDDLSAMSGELITTAGYVKTRNLYEQV